MGDVAADSAAHKVLVAVAEHRMFRGIQAPGHKGETWDWREPRRSLLNSAGVTADYAPMSVAEACTHAFRTDAHFVAYVVRGPDGEPLPWQPRVCKPALPWMLGEGFTVTAQVIMVDIDNPDHRVWTDEDRERSRVEHATIPMLATVGGYSTRKGRRLFQPLSRPLDMEVFEDTVRAYLVSLEVAGVVGVDHRCWDWTRHYRVAHCVREGLAEVPFWLDL